MKSNFGRIFSCLRGGSKNPPKEIADSLECEGAEASDE